MSDEITLERVQALVTRGLIISGSDSGHCACMTTASS